MGGCLVELRLPAGFWVHTGVVSMGDRELHARINLVVGEQLSLERRAASLTCLELDQASSLLPGSVMDAEQGGKLSVR